MPVNRSVLLKLVFDDDADGLALPQPNLRAGKAASIGPNITAQIQFSNNRPAGGRREKLQLSDRR